MLCRMRHDPLLFSLVLCLFDEVAPEPAVDRSCAHVVVGLNVVESSLPDDTARYRTELHSVPSLED